MERIIIVANGKISKRLLKDIRRDDYIIGVDRGAYWLIANSVIPNIAIGDFDSVNAREFQTIKNKVKTIKKFSRKKDFTDMELAIKHARSLCRKEVIIYGAIGTRLDHTMANIHILERLGSIGVIRDANNEMRLISGRLAVQKDARYRYVSILPVTETIDVTLTGFLYDVFHARIRRGQTLGVSNEIRGHKATVEVHRGRALVIRSRD